MAKLTLRAESSYLFSHTTSTSHSQPSSFTSAPKRRRLLSFPSKHSLKFRVFCSIKEKESIKRVNGIPAGDKVHRVGSGSDSEGESGLESGSGAVGFDLDWPPWKNIPQRYKLIGTTSLAFVICNMDKVNLSIAIIPMSHQFGWSSSVAGLVQSSFFWGYALSQLPGGWLAKIFGGRKVLEIGVLTWSLATALVPFVAGFTPGLIVSRILVGIGEGVSPSAATDLIARTIPLEERSRAVAVVFGGLSVGSVAGFLPMWVATVPHRHRPLPPVPTILTARPNPKLFYHSLPKPASFRFGLRLRLNSYKASAAKKQLPEIATRKSDSEKFRSQEEKNGEGLDLGWLPAFPHVFIASMSNFLFGYHIGVMNGPIVSIARELGFEGNSILEGLVVSIFIVGAFLGSICCGSIVDKLGCRRTFQIDTIPLILGALISAQAHSLDEVLLGRFLVGLGIGVNTVLVPIYISEIAPTKYRGSLGTLCQIGTCLGIISSLFLGIPSETDPHWWRTMLYIASVPGFVLALGMQFAADSPRWLCKVGRLSNAKEVIKNVWGASEVEKAIEEFQAVIKNDGSDLESSWLDLLEEPNSRVACIGGALFVFQQFAGINGVLYFSSLTFQDVGITSSALASLLIGVTNLAGALCALYLIDKQGRQKLLIGSYLGMAVSMFLVVYAISFPLDEELGHNLSILGTVMYIFTFAIGAGPVTGLIIPELSSSRSRGKIMGFSFSAHWVCNFLVGLFFLDLVEKFGVAPVYGTFGGVSLLAAIFSTYFIVETKGRSLEDIEMSLSSDFIARGKK